MDAFLISSPVKWYTFRYDYTDEELLEKVGLFIKQNCRKYVIFKEIATETGKPHVQGKLIPIKSVETFRRGLQDKFKNVFVKSNYSIVMVKKEDYDKYICKEKNVWINNVWSQEEIENNYTEYWKVNNKIASKIKKEKVKSWSEELTQEIDAAYPNRGWIYDAVTMKIIGDKVLEKLGKTSKKLSLTIYRDLCLGQLNALNPDSGLKHKMYMDAFPDLYGML